MVRPATSPLAFILCAIVLSMFAWLAFMLLTLGATATNATVASMIASCTGGSVQAGPVAGYMGVLPAKQVVMNTATGEERVVMV